MLHIFKFFVDIDMKTSVQLTLFIAIMCGSVGGIVVASILKLLDNIVKVKGKI